MGRYQVVTDTGTYEIETEEAPTENPVEYDPIGARARQVGQGALLGFADEAEAGARSLGADALGFGKYLLGLDGGEVAPRTTYDERVEDIRAQNKQFEADNPYEAIALQLAGGLGAAGGAHLAAKAGMKGAGAVNALLNPQVSGMGSAARAGATQGAIYGLGSGEGSLQERLPGAAAGAGTGFVAGGAIGGLLGLAGGAAKTEVGNDVADLFRSRGLVPGEAGVVRTGAAEGGPTLSSKAQAYIARKLAGQSDDELDKALARMTTAEAEGSPMYLAEAFGMTGNRPGAKKLTQGAKYVASFSDSADDVTKKIGSRIDEAGERVTGLLDAVAPLEDDAGSRVVQGANTVIDGVIGERTKAAKPLYDAIRKKYPELRTDAVEGALTNKRVKEAIEFVRKEIPEYSGKADQNFDILNEARRYLYGEQEKAIREGQNYIAGLYRDARSRLTSAMDEAIPGEYKAARKAFEDRSTFLSGIQEGPLGAVANLAEGKADKAGAMVFKMRPSDIEQLKMQLGPDSRDAFRAMIRGHLQTMADGTQDGFNKVRKAIGSKQAKDRIRAALGEDEGNKLIENLQREDWYQRFSNMYGYGSDTASNLAEGQNFSRMTDAIDKLSGALSSPLQFGRDSMKGLAKMTTRRSEAKYANDLAKILFDTGQGRESLEQIVPYLKDLNRYHGGVDWLTKLAQKGGGITGGRAPGLKSSDD